MVMAIVAACTGSATPALTTMVVFITPSPIDRGTRYCFIVFDRFLCLHVCIFLLSLFLCCQDYEKNGWTDLHEIFREGAEWSWDLIQFWVNSEKPRDAAMLISLTSFVNITSKWLDRFERNFQGRCGVIMGRTDYVFGQFRETVRCRDAQHGDGVCCAFAPQLVGLEIGFKLKKNARSSACDT